MFKVQMQWNENWWDIGKYPSHSLAIIEALKARDTLKQTVRVIEYDITTNNYHSLARYFHNPMVR